MADLSAVASVDSVLVRGADDAPRVGLHPSVRCTYIDTSVWEPRAIGQVHERLASASWPMDAAAMRLHTCQRIEAYRCNVRGESSPAHDVLGIGAEVAIGDPLLASRRLAEIAAGVRSELLGEGFVLRQVERAADLLPTDHPIRPVARDAVAVARWVRARHGLVAPVSYPELALRLLKRHQDGGPERGLLIVGGGMLAQAVADRAENIGYPQVLLVTRSPKKLRGLRLPANSQPCTVGQADLALGAGTWDVVIATTNTGGPYRSKIQGLVTDARCRFVVDLSAVPVLRWPYPPDCYVNLYDPRFAFLVADHNASMVEAADRARTDIADVYGGAS